MRIGIDAHVLGKGAGGVERFLSRLVALLPDVLKGDQLIVFVDDSVSQNLSFPDVDNLEIVPLRLSNPLFTRSILFPWLVRRHSLDVLLVQRLLPWFCGRCHLVVTVHDITPIKYPKAYRGLTFMLVRWFTGDSVRRASLIFTPTQAVADEVARHFDVPAKKIVPFYNGVDTQVFHPMPDDHTPPYIFMSGAIEARRNIEALLCASAMLGEKLPWQIRIAGNVRDSQYFASLKALVDELGLTKQVQWLGFVDDKQLIELYQRARVFVAASHDEGFNIPPLEAMACDIPVLCSEIPVHRELFSGSALFFSPQSSKALADALLRLHDDAELNEQLRRSARNLVVRLSWPAMAHRVGEALVMLENKASA